MRIVIAILFTIIPLVSLMFLVRLTLAAFSTKYFVQMRRRPILTGVWAVVAVIGVMMFFGPLNSNSWPPTFVLRHRQRQTVIERVQKAGGWKAVRLGCETLVQNYPGGLQWNPQWHAVWPSLNPKSDRASHPPKNMDFGPLPSAISILKPMEISFHPEVSEEGFYDVVVKIRLFGVPSTGGRAVTYYGLEVPCGPGAAAYRPKRGEGGVPGNSHSTYRKVADRVFEIY